MTWPTVPIVTTSMDAGTDTPPRDQIKAMADAVNDMIATPPVVPPSSGRLLGVQEFTASGSYVPTAGTSFIVVEMQGGGGAGGGCDAAPSGQSSVSSGGASGAYRKILLTSGFGPASTVTIGAGGVAASAANGGNGGDTYFTTGATARRVNGGAGGTVGTASATYPRATNNSSSSASSSISGSYQSIEYVPGSPGGNGLALSTIISGPGAGAGTVFSAAAPQRYLASGTVGGSNGYGAGGSGGCVGPGNSALAGEAGQPGIVVVWEYA